MTHDDSADLIFPDARALARQAVESLCTEWQSLPKAENSFIKPLPFLPENLPSAYDRNKLLHVCEFGDLAALKELIAQNIDIEANDGDALQHAAWNKRTELVRLLLDSGANIHARDDYAVRMAASNGDLDSFLLLVERGANIHAFDNYALRLASFNGHTKIAAILLGMNANIHADNDISIAWAAGNGWFETVALLIENGAPLERLSLEQREIYKGYQRDQMTARSETLCAAKALTKIFNGATWAGHLPEMKALWSQVPKPLQAEFDIQHVITEVSQLTLKQSKPKIVIIK